jgi:hypothetical protein
MAMKPFDLTNRFNFYRTRESSIYAHIPDDFRLYAAFFQHPRGLPGKSCTVRQPRSFVVVVPPPKRQPAETAVLLHPFSGDCIMLSLEVPLNCHRRPPPSAATSHNTRRTIQPSLLHSYSVSMQNLYSGGM